MGVPWCFYPSNYGYNVETYKDTPTGFTATLKRAVSETSYVSPFSPSLQGL